MKRILVVKLRALGDTLLSGPAFEAIRKGFPQARITALVDPSVHELFQKSGWADEVMAHSPQSMERYSFITRAWKMGRLTGALQKRFFDLAVDLSGTIASAQLTAQSGAALKVGLGLSHIKSYYDSSVPWPEGKGIPSLEGDKQVLKLLELEAQPHDRSSGYWPIPEEAVSYADTFWKANRFTDQDLIMALSPFAAYPTREWYPSKWAMVIRELDSKGVKCFFTCLPAQKERLKVIEKEVGPSLPVYSGMSLLPLLGLYRRSAAFLGVNAAYRHLAAGVGTPTLTLWGPDPLTRNHPYSTGNHPQVLKSVPCRPCRLTVCVDKKHECMVALQPEDVLKAVKQTLKRVTAL